MPSNAEQILELVEKSRGGVRAFQFNDLERKVWLGKLHGLLQRYDLPDIRTVIEDAYADGKARFLSPNELGRAVAERFGSDDRRVQSVRRGVDEAKRFRVDDFEAAWCVFLRDMAHIPADKMTRRRCLFVDEWIRDMRQYSDPTMAPHQIEATVKGVCGDEAWSEWKGWTDRLADPRTMPSQFADVFRKFRAAMARAPEVVE